MPDKTAGRSTKAISCPPYSPWFNSPQWNSSISPSSWETFYDFPSHTSHKHQMFGIFHASIKHLIIRSSTALLPSPFPLSHYIICIPSPLPITSHVQTKTNTVSNTSDTPSRVAPTARYHGSYKSDSECQASISQNRSCVSYLPTTDILPQFMTRHQRSAIRDSLSGCGLRGGERWNGSYWHASFGLNLGFS